MRLMCRVDVPGVSRVHVRLLDVLVSTACTARCTRVYRVHMHLGACVSKALAPEVLRHGVPLHVPPPSSPITLNCTQVIMLVTLP